MDKINLNDYRQPDKLSESPIKVPKFSFTYKLKDKDKESFYSELSVLLSSRIDLKTSVEIIINNITNNPFKQIVTEVFEHIIKGNNLAESLQKTNKFSSYDFYSIQLGEESATLNQVLNDLADFYKKRIQQRQQIISALTYPAIILTTALFALIFMLNFVVPLFADIFKNSGSEIPPLTKFIINLSAFIKSISIYVIFFLFSCFVFVLKYKDHILFRKYVSEFLISIPFFGALAIKIHLSRFSTAFAALTSSKVPLIRSLDLIEQMTNFYPIKETIQQIKEDVTSGVPLNVAMSKFKIYPSKMIALVRIAEEVNELDVFFNKLSQQFSSEVDYQTKVLGTVLEPLLIIFLGIIVGFILITMYLPLFTINDGFLL